MCEEQRFHYLFRINLQIKGCAKTLDCYIKAVYRLYFFQSHSRMLMQIIDIII